MITLTTRMPQLENPMACDPPETLFEYLMEWSPDEDMADYVVNNGKIAIALNAHFGETVLRDESIAYDVLDLMKKTKAVKLFAQWVREHDADGFVEWERRYRHYE